MQALTEQLARLPAAACLLATLAAAAPADAASPYRLDIRRADYRLRLPAPPAPRPLPGLAALIERHARSNGLDPALVQAVVRVESAYRAGAVSPKGAIGLMQVMPATGRRFGVTDLANPDANLRAGTAYLSRLIDRFDDLALALAAYNAGEDAVVRHGYRIPPFAETRAYVQDVMRSYGLASPSGPAPRAADFEGTRLNPRLDLSLYRLRHR